MIEKLWEFADALAMPNATTAICTYIIDWTANSYVDMAFSGVELYVVVTCNTVPGAGTSLKVEAYQHSTTTITSGNLLDTGADRAIAYMSASAQSKYHWLYVRELRGLLLEAYAFDGTLDRYFGLVLDGTGDVSTGKVDAWLQLGPPPLPLTQVVTSNI